MSSRSILGLIYVMQGLRELGEDAGDVLARHGLDPDKLDPATRISREREMQIYVDLVQRLRDPLTGLKVGNHFGLGGYGPLVMLFMTAKDAYDAVQLGVRYQKLTFLYSELSFQPGERVSALVLKPMPMPSAAFRFRVDGEISGTYKLVRDLQAAFGGHIVPERVDMPYLQPPEAAAYAAHFGCPVHFDQGVARLWFRNDYLHVRFPTADPLAHAMYRSQCDRLLVEQASQGERLSDRVTQHLQMFVERFPSTPEVARAFDLSERSLRRRLQEEGTSFRALVNEVKMQKAQQMLEHTQQSVEHIAQQLGYAEAAAFIHAFSRWTGSSPAAYRAAMKRAAACAGG